MKTGFLLLAGASLLAQLAIAQSVPSRSFTLGPAVGIDQMTYGNTVKYVDGLSNSSPIAVTYGIDASYQVNRFLFGAKALYRQQAFHQKLTSPSIEPIAHFDSDLRVINVPISVSYRITRDARFQWYAGGTIAGDYLLSIGRQTLFDGTSEIVVSPSNKRDFGKSLNIGYGAQTTLRYQLTPVISVQIEPALRYYPRGGFPTSINGNYQFQSVFSVLLKV